VTTVTVSVTQADIDAGLPGDCIVCPIAQALCRALPGARVRVYTDVVHIDGTRIVVPGVARRWIYAFDRADQVVEPFTFELRLTRRRWPARALRIRLAAMTWKGTT
jgi:hypothetical protein